MQLVISPCLIFRGMFVLDLVVRETLHSPGVEFIQHSHLLDVKIIFVKVLCRLDTPFQHRSPHAEAFRCVTSISVALSNVFRVRRGRVARLRREMSGCYPVLLTDIPCFALALNEPSKGICIGKTRWAKVRVSSNLATEIVVGFAMPSNPDLSR